jgi:putative ABC transport system permease protein
MPPFRPMLASLTRHKLTVLLLVLQVTATFAIVCNVGFMIALRTSQLRQPSGIAEQQLVTIDSIGIGEHENPLARHAADLVALRAIAGVQSAAAVDTLPLTHNDWSNGVSTSPQDHPGIRGISASAYNGTHGELATLGLKLLEGRDFQSDDYLPEGIPQDWNGIDKVAVTIVTRALAQRLFPDGHALGRAVYLGSDHPVRIVGVIDHLLRPQLRDADSNEYAMLFPMLPDDNSVTYVLRSAPDDRERILKAANAALLQADGERILSHAQTFDAWRNAYFSRDRTMIGLLLAAAIGLLTVTAIGIAGLASFWVQQRRRSIGVRRALGASRGDILRYVQLENLLIIGLGIVLGMLLACLLNAVLMRVDELPRLPMFYLPIGALALALLGQLAILGPARRAAAVQPMEAVRG